MAKRKALYMLVTADEYELPCGVFESELSIAREYRTSRQAVHNSILIIFRCKKNIPITLYILIPTIERSF